MTKVIAYPDADLSSGLSTESVLICGDRESILKVKSALHDQQLIPEFRKLIADQQKQIEKLQKQVSDDGWENERLALEYDESERYSWK